MPLSVYDLYLQLNPFFYILFVCAYTFRLFVLNVNMLPNCVELGPIS